MKTRDDHVALCMLGGMRMKLILCNKFYSLKFLFCLLVTAKTNRDSLP